MTNLAEENKAMSRGQREIDEIVAEMVKRGYLVEATYKNGYELEKVDAAKHFGSWDKRYNENLAMVLINAYFGKGTLIQLVTILLERGDRRAFTVENVPSDVADTILNAKVPDAL